MHRILPALLVASCLVPGCANEIPQLPLTKTRAITGGTLAITQDGIAVAADTDRDVVSVVDLDAQAVTPIKLTAGDAPGRVVIDAAGRAHVVLRQAGAVATIDTRSAAILDRREVCPAPRGIAYDAAHDVVHVACAGGELVTLPAAGGPSTRSVRLDRDLRDVVVQGDTLLVSRFRSAELLAVSAVGNVLQRRSPLQTTGSFDNTVASQPTVAWRTLALPSGEIAMLHQRATATSVGTDTGAYGWGSNCGGGIVESTVTFFDGNGNLGSDLPMPELGFETVLAVDIAADDAGNLGVVSAGTAQVRFIGTRAQLESSATTDGCSVFFDDSGSETISLDVTPTAIATWRGRWFVQARERPEIIEVGARSVLSTIELDGPVLGNAGDVTFHASWNGVACAGCHPEGGDDGHVWFFDGIGARRTQNLTGGLMHRAPFHWRGELPDLDALVNEVLIERMQANLGAGPAISQLGRWLDALPANPPSPTGTPEQIEHGKQLFHDPLVGCAGCHAGPYLTTNERLDVGTGKTMKVSSLVGISARAPFFHDGCATTLEERFDASKASCNGGDQHGQTSQLGPADIHDLIAYLETL
ncbi:Cytochrome c551 peroxidase [Minicystis rosea]|nr:Cytochrome c551 peroxidase [Minicystis rosea]